MSGLPFSLEFLPFAGLFEGARVLCPGNIRVQAAQFFQDYEKLCAATKIARPAMSE